jgi:hypothetical protein
MQHVTFLVLALPDDVLALPSSPWRIPEGMSILVANQLMQCVQGPSFSEGWNASSLY